MPITIGANISALRAQRQLNQASNSLSKVFERLASGARINRSSDDAAGLSIAETLRSDARVYTQGIRNINDGLNLLSIEESALDELTNILLRQQELVQQSANGVYTHDQRLAINTEINTLVEEYNRIVESVQFNNKKLLEDPTQSLRIQAGYGIDGSISFNLAEALARDVGDGTYNDAVTISDTGSPRAIVSADLDNDGDIDLLSANHFGAGGSVHLNNGDGTFAAEQTFSLGGATNNINTGDINGDGYLDFIVARSSGTTVQVHINNGDGTFDGGSSYDVGSTATAVALGDLNNDGFADLLVTGSAADELHVALGNGDGSYGAMSSFSILNQGVDIETGDFNNDGNLDVAVTSFSTGADGVDILLGDGGGSFYSQATYFADNARDTTIADFNGDGNLDFATARQTGTVSIRIGNGDGSFTSSPTISVAAGDHISETDINRDGITDLITHSLSTGSSDILFGVGDGTFENQLTYNFGGGSEYDFTVADVNGDGAVDLITADGSSNTLSIHNGNTTQTTLAPVHQIYTQEQALDAIEVLDELYQKVLDERGAIGAIQSRLGVATEHLRITRENFVAAGSRITDADVAEESAQLVRAQILQRAASQVLSLSKVQPDIALSLLIDD